MQSVCELDRCVGKWPEHGADVTKLSMVKSGGGKCLDMDCGFEVWLIKVIDKAGLY